MNRTKYTAFPIMKTALLALLFLSSGALGGTAISFQQLKSGNTIDIIYDAEGCFFHEVYELNFERTHFAKIKVKVINVKKRWNEASKEWESVKKIPMGILTLSNQETVGLDHLLEYYRSKPEGMSTDSEHVNITQKTGVIVTATEAYYDNTGLVHTFKNITTLGSIINKLIPKED